MALDDAALDILFRHARTRRAFADTPVSDADVEKLYELVKLGPTSANCTPPAWSLERPFCHRP